MAREGCYTLTQEKRGNPSFIKLQPRLPASSSGYCGVQSSGVAPSFCSIFYGSYQVLAWWSRTPHPACCITCCGFFLVLRHPDVVQPNSLLRLEIKLLSKFPFLNGFFFFLIVYLILSHIPLKLYFPILAGA